MNLFTFRYIFRSTVHLGNHVAFGEYHVLTQHTMCKRKTWHFLVPVPWNHKRTHLEIFGDMFRFNQVTQHAKLGPILRWNQCLTWFWGSPTLRTPRFFSREVAHANCPLAVLPPLLSNCGFTRLGGSPPWWWSYPPWLIWKPHTEGLWLWDEDHLTALPQQFITS